MKKRERDHAHTDWLVMVGHRLKDIRKARGYTYTVVTENTGVPRGPLTEIEKGEREPSLRVMWKLCRWYGVSVDEIIN